MKCPDALEAFGMAVSAHSDDVDDLEESYKGILEQAAALTEGAVTITDVRLREDEEQGEILEFAAQRRPGDPTDRPSVG